MAAPAVQNSTDEHHALGVIQLLITGAITSGVIFAVCWLGTFIPYSSPTHAYIEVFTNADVGSVRALAEGAVWSLLFGGSAAAVFALVYNAVAAVGRR